MKPIHLTIPIWDSALTILFCGKGLKKRLKALRVRRRDIRTAHKRRFEAITFFTKDATSVIVFREALPLSRMIGTLSHEIFHAAQDILEERGVYLSRHDGNETHTYLAGYLMEKVLEKMRREKK
jgi:hypothetical protein